MTIITHFHGDDVTPSTPADALFHIISAPYEKTTSYGQGTSRGPQAILEASSQLELFDGMSIPANYGIYTASPLDCRGPDEEVLQRITSVVDGCLVRNKVPIVIGGEHTVTLGSINSLVEKHDRFGVVHFDAHADLRDTYHESQYSHACVMRRIFDKNIPFFQLGTRSYSHEEHLFRNDNNIPYLNDEDIFKHGTESFSLPPEFPDKIYLTFDVDVFDPSIMPATGTPVPGGVGWYHAMWLIEKILKSKVCIGFDVVEFAPIPDLHSASYTAAQLIYNIMGYLTRSEVNKKYYKLDTGCCL